MAAAFDEAREAWLAAPFPEGSKTSDAVDALKADLAYWDYMVADIVLPYSEGRGWFAAPVDVERGIADLRTRISACRSQVAERADSDRLRQYEGYAELLARVYTEGQQEVRA